MGNLELMRLRVLKDEETTTFVDNAISGVDRGAEITRKLLNYSRMDAGEMKLVSVNKLIEEMDELIARTLTVSVRMKTQLAENIWLVKINSGDLQDALLNLSLNARDAMPGGGCFTIETSNKVLDEDYLRLNPEAVAGEYVMISVSDTGTGMPLETHEKALEPFFTTKVEGKGTGLGLSMVYSFVRRSGGSIRIHSEVGEGTTVRIYLPRAHEYGEIESLGQTRSLLPKGNETILIVDDEKALNEVSAPNLESLGYRTLTAETGKHALKLLEDNKHIDLLFSDIVMPSGMDGYQLALAAHRMRPSLKILLTSGLIKKREQYVADEGKYLTELVTNIVNKPYSLSELARAIRKTLDEERRAVAV